MTLYLGRFCIIIVCETEPEYANNDAGLPFCVVLPTFMYLFISLLCHVSYIYIHVQNSVLFKVHIYMFKLTQFDRLVINENCPRAKLYPSSINIKNTKWKMNS